MAEQEARTPDVGQGKGGRWVHLFAGVGMGGLLGLVMGLSAAPVVQGVLGALVAVLAGFLGFQGLAGKGAAFSGNRWLEWSGLRAGGFGLAAIAGILCGMAVRTQGLLEPTVAERVQSWEAAGFAPERAREIVSFELLGIEPKGEKVNLEAAQKAARSYLYSYEGNTTLCDEIKLDTLLTVENVLAAYELELKARPNEKLGAEVIAIRDLATPEERDKAVRELEKKICE